MALLECKNLKLTYEGRTIIEKLSFKVERGDCLCIVGENGSGKTTLMKALLGLKNPASGEIIFGEGLKKKSIGYLPQQSGAQRDFPATVKEVVLSGCLGKRGGYPFYKKEDRKLAEENMKKMGIAELAGRCYRELSGGQQQRVLLARALCAAQELILLDEPVAGLDPKVSSELYTLISHLRENHKMTVIMISHDIYAALKYSTHILHIGHSPLFFGSVGDYRLSQIGRMFVGTENKEDEPNE